MKNFRANLVVLIIYLFYAQSSVFAEGSQTVFHSQERQISYTIDFLIDSTNSKSFEELKGTSFIPSQKSNLVFGLSPNTFWVKVNFRTDYNGKVILGLNRTLMDSVFFYYRDINAKLHKIKSGLYYSSKQSKKLNYPYIEFDAQDIFNKQIFIQVRGRYPVIIPIQIETPSNIFLDVLSNSIVQGIFLGGLLIMTLYNFFLWFIFRETSYLIYVFGVFTTFLIQFAIQGYMFQYLNLPASFNYHFVCIAIGINTMLAALFAIHLLNIKTYSKTLYRWVLGLVIIGGLIILADLFNFWLFAKSLLLITTSGGAIVLMVIGYLLWLKHNVRVARYFSIAWTIYFLGLVVYSLKSQGILPYSWFTHNFVHIGKFLEVALLSFGLGYKYNQLKKEKQILQQKLTDELESLVTIRTQELNTALSEKEILLIEINHRVKNNLQIVNSLINIQKRRFPKELSELFKSLQRRIGAIALVHEQLYTQNLYTTLNAYQFVQKLTGSISKSLIDPKDEIEIELNIDESLNLSSRIAVPIGLIISEALSNSLKYAFHESRSGLFSIKLLTEKDHILLIISDSGTSIGSAEQLNNTSLGMRIIQDMCRQMQAQMSLDKENGYTYYITIKDEGEFKTTTYSK